MLVFIDNVDYTGVIDLRTLSIDDIINKNGVN
jgi:hypothetical protein